MTGVEKVTLAKLSCMQRGSCESLVKHRLPMININFLVGKELVPRKYKHLSYLWSNPQGLHMTRDCPSSLQSSVDCLDREFKVEAL